jgi:hypothetical protein
VKKPLAGSTRARASPAGLSRARNRLPPAGGNRAVGGGFGVKEPLADYRTASRSYGDDQVEHDIIWVNVQTNDMNNEQPEQFAQQLRPPLRLFNLTTGCEYAPNNQSGAYCFNAIAYSSIPVVQQFPGMCTRLEWN